LFLNIHRTHSHSLYPAFIRNPASGIHPESGIRHSSGIRHPASGIHPESGIRHPAFIRNPASGIHPESGIRHSSGIRHPAFNKLQLVLLLRHRKPNGSIHNFFVLYRRV